MMRLLISFIFGALGAVIMYNIKSNFSFPVTTIVLVVFVAACLHFDLVKRKKSKDQNDKKYEFIWWIATILMVLVMTLNTVFVKIDPKYNIIVVLIHILFMVIIKSRWKKAKTD
ncbi:hypothetical protein FTE28_04080 [Bacillus licheniformis]|uniref:Uncharacterized protein n=6 Tax=Bacillaceae TaxID=186817 RepID=Q65IW6_BACLD|nr:MULTISPECIES: hypothetical protein [Bacillus]AAU23633.2 hypothetical protein BL00299 [Bacillus licheniformis DSM 13 = ATCC 14580]APJ27163.1 hypothetical protein BSZ43_10350 [Bacillus sp. H15-1]ASV15558.1 hypothetical protein CJO35_10440 [Bacillus sp. 1s-1]KUL13081.1 hypothetical protein LI17339_03435 [Bacillus licheniformis LMG 17339]MBC9088706.1 hypothetical protein [Bacillus sp. Y1]MBJ7888115.1 hypothetical protein [Bacillaceae bacterium HSR45]MBY8346718.1 hypothetical protein [Bacillus